MNSVTDFFKIKSLNINDYNADLVLLVLSGWLSNFLVQYLFFDYPFTANLYQRIGYDVFPLSLATLKIFFWVFVYLQLKKIPIRRILQLERIGRKLYDKDGYKLNFCRVNKEWEFQGHFHFKNGKNKNERYLAISNMPSGALIKKGLFNNRSWKNFESDFSVSFNIEINTHDYSSLFSPFLGVIFRAIDIDNYYMLGIGLNRRGELLFRTHSSVHGDLDIQSFNSYESTYSLNCYNRNTDLNFRMRVMDSKVDLYILEGAEAKSCFSWNLPTYHKSNLYQSKSNGEREQFDGITVKIPFKNSHGQFGFRAFGNEYSRVSDLRIRTL